MPEFDRRQDQARFERAGQPFQGSCSRRGSAVLKAADLRLCNARRAREFLLGHASVPSQVAELVRELTRIRDSRLPLEPISDFAGERVLKRTSRVA